MQIEKAKNGNFIITILASEIRKEEKETNKTFQTFFGVMKVKHEGKVKKVKVSIDRKKTEVPDDIPEL